MQHEGCSPSGINQFVIVANGYLKYGGAREFQMVERLDAPGALLLELARNEYLHLLSAVRSLDWEQAYLQVKVFGNSDLFVQELMEYAERMGIQSGPIFLIRSGKAVECSSGGGEKEQPRYLHKLYRAARVDIAVSPY